MKLHLQCVISFLAFMYVHVVVDAQGEVTAAVVINPETDAHGNHFFQLPFSEVPSITDSDVIRACPAESDQDIKYISMLAKKFYKFKYCLFEKRFLPEQTKTCREDPKPILSVTIDEQTKMPKKCGPKSRHQLHEFGYYYCGASESLRRLEDRKTRRNLKTFRLNTYFLHIYDLCIDTKKGFAIWTKHRIMTPPMYLTSANLEKLKLEQQDLPISTDALLFSERSYKKKAKKYTGQKNDQSKVNPNFMVPKEHIALKSWQKAVSHYIVVAPLLAVLQNLMAEFNKAINRLALILYQQKKLLTIYTKVVKISRWHSNQNIWYRLLYEERTGLAMLVVIKNVPQQPPTPKEIKTLCQTTTHCNMRRWFAKEGEVTLDVTDDNLQYIFCCDTSPTEVLKLFNIHLYISGNWNIDAVFENSKINPQQKLKKKEKMPESALAYPQPAVAYPPPGYPPQGYPPQSYDAAQGSAGTVVYPQVESYPPQSYGLTHSTSQQPQQQQQPPKQKTGKGSNIEGQG